MVYLLPRVDCIGLRGRLHCLAVLPEVNQAQRQLRIVVDVLEQQPGRLVHALVEAPLSDALYIYRQNAPQVSFFSFACEFNNPRFRVSELYSCDIRHGNKTNGKVQLLIIGACAKWMLTLFVPKHIFFFFLFFRFFFFLTLFLQS